MNKPKIKYDIKTGLWGCTDGQLKFLGEDTDPLTAYDLHMFYKRYSYADKVLSDSYATQVRVLLNEE